MPTDLMAPQPAVLSSPGRPSRLKNLDAAAVLFVYLSHWIPVMAILLFPLQDWPWAAHAGGILMITVLSPFIIKGCGKLGAGTLRAGAIYYGAVFIFLVPALVVVAYRAKEGALVLPLIVIGWHALFRRYPRFLMIVLGASCVATVFHSSLPSITGMIVSSIPFWCMAVRSARIVGTHTSPLSRTVFACVWSTSALLIHVASWPRATERVRVEAGPAVQLIVDFSDPTRPSALKNTNTMRAVRESCEGQGLWIASRGAFPHPMGLVHYNLQSRSVDAILHPHYHTPVGAGEHFDLNCKTGRIIFPDWQGNAFYLLDARTLEIIDRVNAFHPVFSFFLGDTDRAVLVDNAGSVGAYLGLRRPVDWLQPDRHAGGPGVAHDSADRIWMSHGETLYMYYFNGRTLEQTLSASHHFGFHAPIDYCPATQSIVATRFYSGRVEFFDAISLRPTASIDLERGVRYVRCASGGEIAFVLGHVSGYLHMIHVRDARIMGKIYVGARGHIMTLSHSGNYLYVPTVVGLLRVDIEKAVRGVSLDGE